MRIVAVLVTIFFAGCVHAPPKVLPLTVTTGLYPFGTYQHAVKIDIAEPKRSMQMRGVVSYQPEQLKVIGLTSFGSTAFRIEENLKTGEIKKEFYLDIMKKYEDRFTFFYQLIRELILAHKGQTEFTKQAAHFTISEPDELGIYRHIDVQHAQFNLDIEVTSYDF